MLSDVKIKEFEAPFYFQIKQVSVTIFLKDGSLQHWYGAKER
jgi:hypothetical protein